MKAALFLLFFVAITLSFVCAHPEPQIAVVTNKATPINSGGRNVRCPPNFQQKGKDCISIVLQQPRPLCPAGFDRLTDRPDQCVKYYEKVVGCPSGFQLETVSIES